MAIKIEKFVHFILNSILMQKNWRLYGLLCMLVQFVKNNQYLDYKYK